MAIIDEGAYISEDLFNETVRALTNMKDTGLIIISTPLGPTNFLSLLVNMTNPDGSTFFNVIQTTTICEACAKLPTMAERSACDHCWLPKWKDKGKQTRNAAVGRMLGTVDMTAREDCGVIVDVSTNSCFDSKHVNELFDLSDPKRKHCTAVSPKRIYVACDPNAFGESRSSMVSGYWLPYDATHPYGRFVVIGMDLMDTKLPSEIDEMILNHIKSIRQQQYYSKVPIIFIPENNLGGFHEKAYDALRNVKSVVVFRQRGSGKMGVSKTKELTKNYVDTTNTLMDCGQIVFEENMFTNSHVFAKSMNLVANGRYARSVDAVLDECRLEMTNMRREENGVIHGKGGITRSDDLIISLMMNLEFSKAVENPNTIAYRGYRDLVWVDVPPTVQYPYGINAEDEKRYRDQVKYDAILNKLVKELNGN